VEVYRYKAVGFKSTGPIADNFKALDFYEELNISGDIINAGKAISMKTTKVTDVNIWRNYNSVKNNIQHLKDGFQGGITWNGKTIKYTTPEIHIYMPKDKFTQSIANSWKNTLESLHPQIKFEISTLEKFIKN